MQLSRYLYILILLAAVSPIYADECTQLGVKDQDKNDQGYGIGLTGSYCITDDVSVKEQYEWNHGWSRIYRRPAALGIDASNVKIDLQQHHMTSKAANAINPLAIQVVSNQNNILIKNGFLRVIGKQAMGVIRKPSGSSYITIPSDKKYLDYETTREVDHPEGEDRTYLFGSQKLPPQYQDARITIDNMNIFATYRGVQLADNHNTIRNSTIEVDDNTAIYLMGQYPIIENNTIIIHSNKNNDTFTQKQYNIQIKDGAIKLRDAKGGIIRNNRIIYKGGFLGFGKAPVAINLLDSKDVLIEGNTIEGFDKLVRENGDTSYTESNNTIK
jgi:adenylate cyclase class IV